MSSPKRPDGSIEQLFNRVLLGSLLLHVAIFLLVMNVEPPPPPNQEEYATWLKKVVPIKPPEEVIPEKVEEKEVIKPKKEEAEEIVEEKPTKAIPSRAAARVTEKPGESARRAEVRKQLSGAGLLAAIGSSSEEGGLTNVFESGAAVGKDLGAALSGSGEVRVTGGTRIGKKGALGAGTSADIGEIKSGAGGSAGELGGRAGVVPQAFVKSTEAVLKKGGIDEKGVQMALKRRENGIRQCYERALKSNPKLKGKVALEWAINEQGRVVQIKVLEDTLGDSKVSDCIMDIINKIRFPEATKGIVPVRKTFVFESA
jgi:protein TonB